MIGKKLGPLKNGRNSYTAGLFHYCLKRMRIKAHWMQAIADAIARFNFRDQVLS